MKNIFSRQMLILGGVTFLYMFSISMTNPVMAGLCGVLGGNGFIMGIIGGLSSFVSLFCRPFLGGMIDRNDRRRLTLIGLACMGVGGTACALSPNVAILFAGRLCAGIGLSVCSSTISTWFAASLPPEQIGQGMGLYGVIQALSMAVAPALGLWFAARTNARLPCFIAAMLNIISIFMVIPLTDAHYTEHIVRIQRIQTNTSKGNQLFICRLLPLALLMFLFCVPYNGTTAFLETSVVDRGLSFNVGPYFTIFAIALLLTRFALSRFLDTYPYYVFAWACIPFGVLSMLCLQWMTGIGMMFASAVFMSLSYGIIQPVSQAAGIRSVSEDQQGVANCTYYIGMDLGMAFGPMIAGGVYQILGERSLFYTMAIFPLLAVPVLLLCGRTLKKL